MSYKFVGTIISAGGASKNNENTTGTAFVLTAGLSYYVQATGAGYVASGVDNTTAALTTDVKLAAEGFLALPLPKRGTATSEAFIAWYGIAACNLNVYREEVA